MSESKCANGHEWTHQWGDDWTPDRGTPCDCGKKLWGIPFARMPMTLLLSDAERQRFVERLALIEKDARRAQVDFKHELLATTRYRLDEIVRISTDLRMQLTGGESVTGEKTNG